MAVSWRLAGCSLVKMFVVGDSKDQVRKSTSDLVNARERRPFFGVMMQWTVCKGIANFMALRHFSNDVAYVCTMRCSSDDLPRCKVDN